MISTRVDLPIADSVEFTAKQIHIDEALAFRHDHNYVNCIRSDCDENVPKQTKQTLSQSTKSRLWHRTSQLMKTVLNVRKHSTVWATLAAIALRRNQLDISEEAFAAVLQVDKVDYLNYVKVII